MKLIHFLVWPAIIFGWACNDVPSVSGQADAPTDVLKDSAPAASDTTPVQPKRQVGIDTALFNKKMAWMANGDSSGRWPVKAPYPLEGALLPFKRVVAFYGNLYSKRMGILGELPKKEMLQKLQTELKKWKEADPETPPIAALHYIGVTAQGLPGKDGKYRLRMPLHQLDTIQNWADEIEGLAFVDVQVGLSSLQEELPRFKPYLKSPTFHLGIDPEFSMKDGRKPGSAIGSFSADDINYAIGFLADIVREHHLPPKILVIHRFTNDMVQHYKAIRKVPEVQVVIDMDGWGGKALKAATWRRYIYEQPVQFAGFKIFYKNDLKKGSSGLYAPGELMKFQPIPLYIQYQ
ncbi:hypothetical protein ABDK00_015150 [Niabella insulamsoli]|uniref:hypothetical protein n=1 Tax=Niabella insulamsoli TaxID=3144874 RepID=UPI0031FBFF5D